MSETCDVVVVGAGAMGSSAAWWLARRGRDVIVIDQFGPGHDRGASHGGSRIFRLAYPEPDYVRLAQAALPLWRILADEAGEELLVTTGGVDHGDPAATTATAGTLRQCGAEFEMIGAAEAGERWPGMRFEGTVCFQPDAGCARADATVAALQRGAAAAGARLRWHEPVLSIDAGDGQVTVTAAGGDIRARAAVMACGAWTAAVLGEQVPLPALRVTQEQVFHFAPSGPMPWPSFIHHRPQVVYGLETPGEGVKVAEHHAGVVLDDPDARTFEVDAGARRRVSAYAERWLPGLVPGAVSEKTCLYTTTPTEDFVIDRHGSLVVAAGFSGHGFKFTPLIGRMLADLADGTSVATGRFALSRPSR